MGDTFLWVGRGTTTDWSDPSNWRQFSGGAGAADILRIVGNAGGPGSGAAAARASGAADDVVFDFITQPVVTGGGEADTVVLRDDGNAKILTGSGTEHYRFSELFLGTAGSAIKLDDALLDTGATYVPDGVALDVSGGAVGIDGDGRPYTASLGALRLEAVPGSLLLGRPSPGGQLVLGDRTVDVTSLVQGTLGVGDAFDPRAGIVGTGEVHFPAAVSPASPYVTTPFTPFVPPGSGPNLPPRLDHLDFGTLAVGESGTLTFTVANVAAGAAQPLLGAVQTLVNGGHVTDPALSGSGVAAGNFFLPPDLARQDFTVTLTGTTAHGLEGQAVHLAFHDGTGVTLPITGTVTGASAVPPPGEEDWNALAAEVQAHFATTGLWF